jgi:hypothetical protein
MRSLRGRSALWFLRSRRRFDRSFGRSNRLHHFCGRRGWCRLRRHHDAWSLTGLRCNQARRWRWGRRGYRHFGFVLTLSRRGRLDCRRRRCSRNWRGCLWCRWRFRCGRGWFRGSSRLCRDRSWRRRLGSDRSSRFRRCSRCLLLKNRLQRVARFGDLREVEFWLRPVFRTATLGSRPRRPISATMAKMRLHLLRFFYADRTGVSFLFSYTDLRENVQNGLALDLQFSRQIIDSNLIYHPPSIFLRKTR